jgi:hypothetical protein
LIHVRRFGRNVEPDVAHKNRAAFELFLMEKLTALPDEAADYGRRVERSIVQIDKINAPLPRRRIVET